MAVAEGGDADAADRRALRMSGALIGIAGAIGAFGGVLVNLAFRQSFLTYQTATAAYLAFIAFYAVCFAVTWALYLSPSPGRTGNPCPRSWRSAAAAWDRPRPSPAAAARGP